MRLDPREKVGGKSPRRTSKDLTFLTENGRSGKKNYLYESQISVLINAFDKNTFVAYCCVDSYYEEDEDHAEQSDENGTQSEKGDDIATLDPLTRLEYAADRPITDAREYFLLVMDIQVKYVCCEWKKILVHLRHQLEHQVSTASCSE